MKPKIFQNKKGQEAGDELYIGEKPLFYVALGVFITALAFILVFVMWRDINSQVAIPKGLEEDLFIQRFVSSEECLAYQDEGSLRVYPGIVDYEKMKNGNLYDCYDATEDSMFAFKLTYLEESVETYNWEDNFKSRMKTIRVKVKKSNELLDEKLIVEIQNVK